MKHPPTTQLISWLMDRDPDMRIQACQGLAIRRIPTTSALVIPALSDAVPGVREAAALACGSIRGPGARRSLERLVTDPERSVVEAATAALALMDSDPADEAQPRPVTESLEMLLLQINHADPQIRAAALTGLGGFSDPAAGPPLLAALDDGVGLVRACAASGLVRHPMGRAREKLLDLLEDEEPEVRCAVAKALGKMRAGEAYPGLTAALGDDFQVVREAAAASLARIGGERIRRELHHAARTWVPGSPPVLDALLELEEDIYDELADWLEHPYEGVRGVAVEWIRTHGDQRFLKWLERLLDDPEPWVQEEAREAVRVLDRQSGH